MTGLLYLGVLLIGFAAGRLLGWKGWFLLGLIAVGVTVASFQEPDPFWGLIMVLITVTASPGIGFGAWLHLKAKRAREPAVDVAPSSA